MKKKIYSGILVLILVGGVFVAYYILNGQRSTINEGALSDRSREYLEKKSVQDGSSELKYIQLTGVPEGASGQTITVGDCFSIQIPFAIDNNRQKEDECHLYISTTRPEGSITAYQRYGGEYLDFDSVPGVSLRRLEKEKYEEKSLKVGDRTFLGFRNKQEGEVTYFYYTPQSHFVITFDMHGVEIASEIKKTLESIEFL